MVPYDSRNWFGHLFAFHGSAAPRIAWRVTLHALWAGAVVAANHFWPVVRMPSTMHALIGLALGLLLVFRTNASYDRFWEGRKAWGEIVNHTRNVARAAAAYMAPGATRDLAAVIRWTIAFPFAAVHALRGRADLGASAATLPPDAVKAAFAAPCAPLAVATHITAAVAEARRNGRLFDQGVRIVDLHVGSLVNAFGVCERIKNTPLPFAYVVHLRRALALYLVTLPFALVDSFGWFTVLDNALIAYVLLGIEEIGVEIENPFGTDANDLPLDQICTNIEAELAPLAAADDTPPSSS